jgi:hypothetical protein
VRTAFANMDTSAMMSAGDEQGLSVSLDAGCDGFGRDTVLNENPTNGGQTAPLLLGLIVKTSASLGPFVIVFGPGPLFFLNRSESEENSGMFSGTAI